MKLNRSRVESPGPQAERRSALGVALAILIAVLAPAPVVADAGAHLRGVAGAYVDVFSQYPQAYACDLRSPELVASLDARGREAWGDGHIRMTQGPRGLRLTAEDLAKPQAAPWFNIALGVWQLKLGTELKVLQGRLPEFFVGVALGALLRYQGFEHHEDGLLRFGLRARGDEAIREASFLVEESYAIRELRIVNRDGSSLHAKVGNLPATGVTGKWLVSEIEATITTASGQVETWSASLGYAPVDGRLLFEHVLLKATDGAGKLLKKRPRDINPISYYFSNCRILDLSP